MRGGGQLCTILACLSFAVALSWRGAADVPPPKVVWLKFAPCSVLAHLSPAVERAVELELREEGVQVTSSVRPTRSTDSASPPVELELEFDCAPKPKKAQIRFFDPRLAPASRSVDLSDLGEKAKPRALALVVAELARSLWSRPSGPSTLGGGASSLGSAQAALPDLVERGLAAPTNSAAVNSPSGITPPSLPPAFAPPQSVPVESPKLRARRPLFFVGQGIGRGYLSRLTLLSGAELGAGTGRMRVGIEALGWSTQDPLGKIGVTIVAATGSAALFSLLPSRQWGVVEGRGALGMISVTGNPAPPLPGGDAPLAKSSIATYGELGVSFRAELPVSRRTSLEGLIDGGYAVGLVAKADERLVANIGGPWLGLRLGVMLDVSHVPSSIVMPGRAQRRNSLPVPPASVDRLQ